MNCPYCNTPCEADMVDIGVGLAQSGPYSCQNCGAFQASGEELFAKGLKGHELRTKWNLPLRNIKLPIDTAPRDETPIILLGESGYIAPWDTYARSGHWVRVPGLKNDGYWADETGDMLSDAHPTPTHWMVMP